MHQEHLPIPRAQKTADRRPSRRCHTRSRTAGRFSTLGLLGALGAVLSGCQSFSCEEERACNSAGGAGASGQTEEETRSGAGLGGAPAEDGAPRSCPAGYRLSTEKADEGRCVDIDECAEGTHTCSTSPEVPCTNRTGGFVCGACPEGYSGDGETPDGCLLTAPTVTATSPTDGARGVAVDAPLVVTFSEAMDPGATEAAFSSDHPSLASPEFSWNAERTELTVTPSAPYPIAEVTSASEPAESVTFTFAKSAEDAQGERLFEAVTGSFSAKKRVTETLPLDSATSGSARASGSGYVGNAARSVANGDSVARALLNYDLSVVPDDAVLERATLLSRTQGTVCSTMSGGPGWKDGVALSWARVSYAARELATATNTEASTMYSTPVLQSITRTVLESDAIGAAWAYVDLDATSGVRRFLEDRGEREEQLNYRVSATYAAGCWWMTIHTADLALVYLTE